MELPIDLIILIFCVLFFAARGFSQGLIGTFFGVFGLLAAYVVCYAWGADIVSKFSHLDPFLDGLLLYPALFLIIMLTLTHIPRLILSIWFKDRVLRPAGAALGGLIGGVVGLFAVWFVGAIGNYLPEKGGEAGSTSELAEVVEYDDESFLAEEVPLIQGVADKFVGEAVDTALSLTQKDSSLGVVTVNALVQNPKVVTDGVQSVVKSGKFNAFWNDVSVQELMAENDIESLTQHQQFRSLFDDDKFRSMVQLMDREPDNGLTSERVEHFVAEKLTEAWRKYQFLGNDPEVSALLNDPELRSLVNEGNALKLLSNRKLKELTRLIAKDYPEMESVDFSQYVTGASNWVGSKDYTDSAFEQRFGAKEVTKEPIKEVRKAEIYRWLDENGVAHFSELGQVPKQYLHSAEKYQ